MNESSNYGHPQGSFICEILGFWSREALIMREFFATCFVLKFEAQLLQDPLPIPHPGKQCSVDEPIVSPTGMLSTEYQLADWLN
jgi:hypothetical protein